LNSLGRAQFLKGNISEAVVTLKSAYEAGLKLGYQFVTTLALMNYSACLQVLGKGEEAILLCNQYIVSMNKHFDNSPPYIGIIYAMLGDLYLNKKDADKAIYYKEAGMKLCQSISFDVEGSLRVYREINRRINNVDVSQNSNEMAQVENDTQPVEDEIKLDTSKPTDTIILDYGERLSERETEILKLVGKGLSNQEIADTLFITINTTQWHLSHIYAKLGVKSRTQAMLRTKELGLMQ
jgi:DNA-binding CsgD family transcriptional regulator